MIRHARMRGQRAAVPARASTTPRSPRSSCSTGSSPGKGRAGRRLGRERYLERMAQFVETTRERHARPAAPGRCVGRLGPPAVHHGRRSRPGPSATAFERLYRADLAYRTEALVNWCPGCRTSVSDLEVVPTPETGTLWTVRYHLIDPATGRARPRRDDHASRPPDPRRSWATPRSRSTRPTRAMPALVGRSVRIPFVERDVPIIADDVVDRAFGTGRRQDHARPRPRRPCDRAASRPAPAHHPRRRRDRHRDRHRV